MLDLRMDFKLFIWCLKGYINNSSVTNRANETYTNQLLAASRILYIYSRWWQIFQTRNLDDAGVFTCTTNERGVAA